MATFKISDIPLVDSNPAETFTPAPTQADVPSVPVIGIPQSSAPPPAMLDTFGQSPWVDEDKDYNQALNDWYRSGQDAVDNAVFDPDKAFKGMNLDFEADPETAKRTLINESWMELNHDEPLAPTELQRAVQMQVASLAKFNEMVSTPEDLYKLIKKDAGKRKDAKDLFRGLGTDAAKAATISAFGEAGQTYQAWRETVKGKPGYDPINEADYFEAWHDAKQQMNESLAPYRAEVTEVWNGWKESTGAGKVVGVASGLIQDAFLGGMGETDAALAKKSTRRTAFDIYDKLTDEEKPKFMEALGVLAANVPKAEKPLFFANIGKQSGRDIESLAQNAGTATVDFMMNPEMWDTSSGSTGKPTEYRRQADFVQRLQNLQEGTYDPVQKVSDSWIGKLGETVAYGTAGVVATSVSAMNPYTATALFASLTENHYQSLLNAQMEAGVSYDKASAYATNHAFVGAAVETASEMVGSRLLRGQLPFFDKALTRAMDKIKNPLLRGGTRFLAGGIESGVQEVGQNYIDPSIRGLSAAFGEDTGTIVMPGAQENIESFVSVLPLALMGIPGAAGCDARVKAFATATDLQMAAVGYTAESVQAIRTGIALGLDSGAAAIDKQVRTPETPEAIAAQEALKAQLASARQALEQLKNLGYAPPTFSVTPEGIFVFDGEGKELGIAPDWDQAQRIAGAHTGALENLSRERQDVLQTLFTATAAAAKLDPSSITEVNLGDFDPSAATPGGAVSYAQQVAMKEKAAGGTGKIAYSVFGYSVTSFAEGLRTTINRLFDGAAVTDVFHETTHGLRRAGHKAGTLTKGMEISLLMNHDLVSGNRRARDAKGKKTGELLRFIPEGITAEMMETGQIPADMIPAEFNGDGALYAEKLLDEGISMMVEVEVLKLRKGEGKLGITRADISLNLRSLAKINSETAGSWTSFFAAVRARWGLTLSRAILFMRAEKNGEFDPAERDAYLDKLLGLDQQTEHDAGVMAEFDAMFGPEKGKVAEDDIPFSIGRATVTTTPETRTFQGAEGSPSVIGPASFSIGAFHGTPHQVDKFSTEKIGTGEGAQAFGWGLYFAKAKAVAEEYQRMLSAGEYVPIESIRKFFTPGNIVPSYSGSDRVLSFNERDQGDWSVTVQSVDEKGAAKYGERPRTHFTRPDVKAVKAAGLPTAVDGNLYTVTLDVNDEDLLDLDKPLSGQNQAIRDILLPLIEAQQAKFPTLIPAGFDIERLAGGGLLNVIGRDESDSLGTDKDASMRLLAAGIPGIRYLDGNSRGAGDGSHNYVIFDESKIQITEENGTPVEIGGEASFSIGKAPQVWESFPDVQWLVPFGTVSNTGGPRIKVPDSRFKERAYNRDWYVAKGKLDSSKPEEQHKAARELIHRVVTGAPQANLDAMREFLRANPQAEIVPVRGLETPNKHENVIPGNFARFLAAVGGQHVNETIHKTNTSHNTGKSAWDRLQQIHSFDGEVTPGAEYIIADDISTSGATTYYAARYITSQGGIVVGSVQMGLTPRGKKNRFHQRAMVGDEQVLSMSDDTKKALQKKGDTATINAVVQDLGIAYDWRTLTDALARALTSNWSKAKNLAKVPGERVGIRQSVEGGRSVNTGSTSSLPAFPGEIEAASQQAPAQDTFSFSIGSVHPELKTTAPGDALPEGLKLAPVADSTSSANINRQFENLDAIFEALPNPLATTSSWVTFMRALGNSLGKTTPVPIAPERAIGYANGQGFDHIMVDLKAHPEYVAARVQGLEVGTRILAGFRDESLKRADLGSLFIWGLLSRGIGAYPQEGAFSAIHRAGLIDQLERVFAGEMTPVELRDWALTAAKGSPMGGAFRNVKAIDQMVQAMMFQIDKKPAIDHLLDLWKSDLSGPQLRREVYRMFTNDRPSIQIQNKVLSFIILVSGRPDVMVLDRVQFRHLWGGSALDGIIANLAEKLQVAKDATLKLRNITKGSAKYKATQDVNTDASNTYDALPVVVSKAEEDRSIEGEAELKAFGQFWAVVLNFTRGKRAGTFDFQKVAGKLKVKRTGLVGLGNGLHGLATYEAIERAMAAQLVTAYQDAGIAYPGVGAFHWDSWLVSSRQAISHPTLDLIAGNKSPGLSVMEGKFNTINYGMLFRYDGQYMRESLTVPGRYIMLTPEAAAKDYTTAAVNKAIGRKGKNQLKLKNAEETDEDGPKERTRPWTEDLTDAERLAFDQWLDTIGTAVQPDPANGTDGRADGGRDAGLDDVQDGAVDSSLEEVGPSFSIGGVKAGGFEKAKAEGRTFTGKDGKERFELDASKAAFNPSGIKDPAHRNGFKRLGDDSPIGWLVPEGKDTPLGNLMDFDELYENYPQMAGLKVRLKTLPAGAHGRFARVEINGKASLEFSNIDLSDKLKTGTALSVLLHEVQHVIQDIEGFAQGGSPEQFQEYDEAGLKLENNKYVAAMRALIDEHKAKGGTQKDAMQSDYGKVLSDSLIKIQDALREPERKYRALPGEKEARGVQVRASMTAEERAATPFMDQYPSYSIGPAKVAGILSDNALARITDPRRRTYVMSKISRDFNAMRLQIERISSLAGIRRSKGDLSREAMAREDLAAEEKIAAIHARFGSLLADEDLVKIKSQPVHAHLADPDTPLRGRLKSKAAAIKSNPERYQLHRAGDYDGSDGVSRSVFGGQNMPDQAAQELFDEGLIKEPTADAMWEALLAEQNTVAGMKEMLLKAKEQIRQAKQEAKQEANEWLATQSKDQEVNFSDKEEIRRALRMLDAILLALPAEIRGKIGGYTQISMITSDEARLAYLQDKLAKADKELETFLRVEYAKEWEELLKKAAPKTNEAGQRPTGSIAADAYDVFRVAEWAMGQSFALGEAEADKWDAIADNPETEIPEADLARVKAQMIRLTTNWNAADAARREQAVLEGDKIYFGGLRALAIDNSRRRERLGKLRTSAIKGTGKTGARMEREAAKQSAASKGGVFREMSWEFLSFGQLVNVLFGEKSDVAKWFNAREISASNAAHDGFQAKANALESLFDTLSGNRFDGEKLRHRMATAQTIKVTDALGVQQSLSDSQAITFLLMWRQEDGRRHMEGIIDEQSGRVISTWGWDEDSAADIEKQLSREGRAVMSFLASSYGEEYDRINEVFRKIWNVSMPRHKMYAPLSVNPVQGKGDTIMDPVSGDTMGAGMTPGSLKNRSFSAIAEPELKDAFQVFLTHARQMEHFIAYGEFSRDALGVINRRETRSAILAAGGPTAAGTLSKWIDYFALGGLQDANMGSKWGRVMGGMLGRISQAALVGRVSVLAMQSLQLAAASFKMPLGSFLTRFAKLSTGQLGWNDAINSEYIQRRVSQMPPLVRDMLAGIASGTPNRAKYLAGILGQTISGADALFTAGTYAIFYDYHLKIAKAAKAENPEAVAHKEAERLTDQVAQPTRTGARSWLEVANQGNPAFRAMWNFSSDPRQKASLIVYEAMRRDTSGLDKAGNVAFMTAKVWIIGGILATLLRTIIRDLRSDDDDEIFDERYWSPSRLALMAFTGPLSAVPYLGGMVEASTYAATGQFMPKGGMLNFMESAASIPAKWAKGKVEPLKDLETLATAGAGLSGTSAAAASVMHIIRDLVGFIENLEGPD